MELTAEQRKVVESPNSCTVLGRCGSGKTVTMIEKAAWLLKQGIRPEEICFVKFSYRSQLLLQKLLEQRFGKRAEGFVLGTFRDLPLACISTGEDQPELIDNTFVRRLLRQAMDEVSFGGTVHEAEHVMRAFKSRGRKPTPDEPYYMLFETYKQLLEQNNMVDRHDLVRRHIIGMRNDIYPPHPARVMLVDDVQDATQIQLLWLVDHMKAGVKLWAFGNDDSCLFNLDGALGGEAFEELEELNDMPRLLLTQNFRNAGAIEHAAEALLKPVKGRFGKGTISSDAKQGEIDVFVARGPEDEARHVVEQVMQLQARNPGTRIGIIPRHDLQARWLQKALQTAEIPFASFARTIWETPGALLVLDLLEVLINRSEDAKLKNVFSGYGVSQQAIEVLFSRGLVADEWLKRGAPLPTDIEVDMPRAALNEIGALQRQLLGYYRLMTKAGPKNVFKAAAYDLIMQMREDDRNDALHALDELLNLKGKLVEILDTIRDYSLPDPTTRVIVAPVREIRNMEFDHVFIPYLTARSYPLQYKVLGKDEVAERRLLHAALMRAKAGVHISYCGQASTFLNDILPFTTQNAA